MDQTLGRLELEFGRDAMCEGLIAVADAARDSIREPSASLKVAILYLVRSIRDCEDPDPALIRIGNRLPANGALCSQALAAIKNLSDSDLGSIGRIGKALTLNECGAQEQARASVLQLSNEIASEVFGMKQDVAVLYLNHVGLARLANNQNDAQAERTHLIRAIAAYSSIDFELEHHYELVVREMSGEVFLGTFYNVLSTTLSLGAFEGFEALSAKERFSIANSLRNLDAYIANRKGMKEGLEWRLRAEIAGLLSLLESPD